MANLITLAEVYTTILDEAYKKGLLTSDLEADPSLVQLSGDGDTLRIPKVSTDGLGDYDRATGYPSGSVDFSWETHTFTVDRAVEFLIDRQDNLETLDIVFAATAGQFARMNVQPEIDAYRFAILAANAGTVINADITATDTVEAVDTAVAQMDNDEVPEENRLLYVTPTVYKNIKNADLFTRDVVNIGDRNVPAYDNMPIIKVPQSRFYTGITLNDGSTSFGYTATTGLTDYEISFMIVYKAASLGVVKQNQVKIFDPETNQDTDGWKMQTRLYHDLFVPDNKVNGIYTHTKATAIA